MVYYVRIWGLVRGGGPYTRGLQGVVEANGQRKTPRRGGEGDWRG